MNRILKYLEQHLEWILAAIVFLPHVYAALSPVNSLLNWYTSDDAFYYFKVAENIASGLGSTFDGINLTNGYHPLWLLICVPVFSLAKVDVVLPLRILVLISAALTAGASVLLYRLGRRALSPVPALLMALIWALASPIHDVVTMGGMETGVSAFFILLFLSRMAEMEELRAQRDLKFRDYLTAGLLAALMILSRLDNIFIGVVAAVWLVFRSQRTRYLVLADLLFSAVSVLLSYYFVLENLAIFYTYSTGVIYMLAVVTIGRVTASWLIGLYEPHKSVHWKRGLIQCAIASILPEVLAFLILIVGSKLGLVQGYRKAALGLDAGFGFLWLILTRWSAAESGGRPATLRERLSKKKILPVIQAAAGYALIPTVTLVAYIVSNQLIFGTPTPVSGQVKHWWASLPNTIYGRPVLKSLADLFGLGPDGGSWSLAASFLRTPARLLEGWLGISGGLPAGMEILFTVFLGLVVCLVGWSSVRQALPNMVAKLGLAPLLVGDFYHSLYYPVSGYLHERAWYWVGEMIFTVLITGCVFDIVWRAFSSNRAGRVLCYAGSAALAGALFFQFGSNLAGYFPYHRDEEVTYVFVEQARELETMTEPGARIGTTGGGGLAYFIRGRTIINLDGLMNSYEYFESMKNGTAAEYLDRIGLQYVLDKKYVLMESDPYRSIFTGRLERIDRIGDITLYHYIQPQLTN